MRPGASLVSGMVLAVSVLSVSPAAGAQETVIRGTIEYQLGYGFTEEDVTRNRLAYEIDVERELGFDGKIHVGWDGNVTYRPEGLPSELELDEAYVDLYLDAADLRIGRQVINWGTADGFNPTNVINPPRPLSEALYSLSVDALSGTPVPAVQWAYYLPSGASVTAVGIAKYVPASDAHEMLGAAASEVGAAMGTGPLPVVEPSPVPADGSQLEFALRGEKLVAGHNVYVTYFRGWDDYPAAWLEYESSPVGPVPNKVVAAYRKVQKFGVATAGTLAGAGVWTEISYTVPDRAAALDNPGALASNEAYVEAVVGADYTFSSGVTVSGQVMYYGGGSLLSPYKPPFQDVAPQTYFAGTARYSPRPGHELEGFALVNLGDGGVIAVGRYTYDINQVMSLAIGLSQVFAGAGAEFKQAEAMANMLTIEISASF
ncbi:MAG: hypothetical protein H0Z37_03100 [Firmicutes bacterium]|nr:hypothetical protein [Bacillota bacterium]